MVCTCLSSVVFPFLFSSHLISPHLSHLILSLGPSRSCSLDSTVRTAIEQYPYTRSGPFLSCLDLDVDLDFQVKAPKVL